MQDGIGLLVEDHHRVEVLFEAVDGRTEPDPATVIAIIRSLSVHDGLESEYLYPLVEDRLRGGNDLALANIADHVDVATRLAEIDRRHASDPHRAELLQELIQKVRSHVSEEENGLFPQLRQHLAPEELIRLGRDLTAARQKVPTRPHPHIPRFSVGTRFVAGTLRPLDRLRDAFGHRR